MKEVTSNASAVLNSPPAAMETLLEGSNNNRGGGSSAAPASAPAPQKKICCACPDTRTLRDECIIAHGEDACGKWINAHKLCLRKEGFKV